MKFGLLIKDRTAQELQYVLNQTDYFLGRDDQFYVFAEDIRPKSPRFPFPFMNMYEAWEFDGTIMCVQPDLAERALSFASPEHRIWLIGNPFWMHTQISAEHLYKLIKAYNGKIGFLNPQIKDIVNNGFKVNGLLMDKNIFETINANLQSTSKPVSLL